MLRAVVVVGALGLASAVVHAQTAAAPEPLKPASIASSSPQACPVVRAPGRPNDAQRRQARDLAQRGRQAAILGDSPSALRALRDASAVDPTDPDLAYQLARAYETVNDGENAAREYCRFAALSPTAPEAGEAREKAKVLSPAKLNPALDSALQVFRSGVAAYGRGQMTDADAAFTNAIAFDSTWATAYYDRALVRIARDDRARAITDFEQYLRLQPEADDRSTVVARIDALRRKTFSHWQALSLGLVVPGGGQFYTGRTTRGLLSIGGVAGAMAVALQERSTATTVQQTAMDAFGNPYTFTRSRIRTYRPHLVLGTALAGAIELASAMDAFTYARASTEAGHVSVSFVPAANAFVARVTLAVP